MNNTMSFSQEAVNLIEQFEGFRASPYPDPASGGLPISIGFGSTAYQDGRKITMQDSPITKAQATDLLLNHLNKIILPDLKKHITTDISQINLDALASLIYNIGSSGFDNSHILIDINQGIMDGDLKSRWLAWDRAAGKVNEGLLNRRIKEYNYFETGSIN